MINEFIKRFDIVFGEYPQLLPWNITDRLQEIIAALQKKGTPDFHFNNGIMIHKSATVEQNVVLKAPIIISADCFVGANSYLRGPVFLDESVKVGAGCEIKHSIIFSETAIAHFNYVGNSIVGSNVNFEAGSVAANHYNERKDKMISVIYKGELIETGVVKFGSLVGDHSRIGANAVLSPGTLLLPNSVVKRLELVEQVK
jgi:UDP-N-acetylglucosamine diphosphorylase / glucose-1-phosphate thymidylyltransferase / UDP-N-acetylgalactosamine diphosphorylase / glucosamine-1-phosphate N-acetyltransferase / galactosamine-1-phosphate N-acetyltransferase